MNGLLKTFFKKKVILFHIDEEGRDMITARSIAEESKRKNYLILFSSRLTAKLYKFFEIEKYIDNIIIPKPFFVKDYSKDFRKKIYSLLPTEAIGYVSYSKQALIDHFVPFGSKTSAEIKAKISKTIVFHFLWGEDIKNSLEKINPIKDIKYFTVGHPRYNNQNTPKYKNKVSSISSRRKLRVGFSTRFDAINSYNFRQKYSFLESVVFDDSCMKWLSKKEASKGLGINERVYKDVQDVRNLFSVMEAIKDNELVDITFRPHPREDIYNWKQVAQRYKSKRINWCLDITNEPFGDWLNSLDVLVGTPSTTFYDCLFLGVFPISIDKLVKNRSELVNFHWDDSNIINKHIVRPKTLEETNLIINKIIENYNKYIPKFWTPEKINTVNGEVDIKKSSKSIKTVIDKIDQLSTHKKSNIIRFTHIYIIIIFVEVIGLIGNLILQIIKQRSSSYWFFSIKERLKIYLPNSPFS